MLTLRRAWWAAVGAAMLLGMTALSPAHAAAQRPELLVQDIIGTGPVAPGDVIAYQPAVHNAGSTTVHFIKLELSDDTYAPHAQQFSNCSYPDGPNWAECYFEIDLAPGETARVASDTPVQLRVLPHAPNHWQVRAGYRATGSDSPFGPPDSPGDGPELRLEKAPDPDFTGGDPDWANVLYSVGANLTDLAAVGAQITGGVGDTVALEVGVTNHGPADIGPFQPGVGDPTMQPTVTVAFTDSVTVVEVLSPADPIGPVGWCVPLIHGSPDWEHLNAPGANVYECSAIETALATGDTWLFRFRVEIAGAGTSAGTVQTASGAEDPDVSNNTADITLTVGSSGGDTDDEDGGGGGGSLPVTGASVGLLAGAGIVALAAGIGLYLLTRRRRVRLTTDDE